MADNYVVERTETIAAPPEDVFQRVGNLERWDNFSPWADMDPDMTKTYAGEPGAVGSTYHWTGNRKVGEGNMTITESEPNERVVLDLKFIKPFRSESVTELELSPSGDGTEVTWRMTGANTFMVKAMSLIGKSMDKMVGPDFEKGLTKLKTVTETG